MDLIVAGKSDKNENEMKPCIFISLVEIKFLSPSVHFRLKKKKEIKFSPIKEIHLKISNFSAIVIDLEISR